MGAGLLLDSKQTRWADGRAAETGLPFGELMERAGAAVAHAAARRARPGARVVVLCGSGSNGGDGYAAARHLAAGGFAITLGALGRAPSGTEARRMAERWTGGLSDVASIDLSAADLIVDALFGTGLSRDLDEAARLLVDRVARSGRPVLAVDVPSGIDADTGAIRGAAVRATATVTFATPKPGHLLYPGRQYRGELSVADIGIPSAVIDASGSVLWENGPALWRDALPRLGAVHHKYDRGHALVLSGTEAHTGAARLAARAALRAGAGLVSVVTPRAALAANAAHLTAIMLRVSDGPDELRSLLRDGRFNAVALGPALGIGAATRDLVAAVLAADRATVLDADALTSLSGEVGRLIDRIGSGRESPVVLTPHDGEFRRLFAGEGEPLERARAVVGLPSKVERARAAARLTGAVVVLKGPDTVVADPDGRAAINTNGSPHLATAGSGDVLGGIVTGLMAQGMPGFEAASAAVWMHADAATRFGPGLIAEDLPEMLPTVITALYAGP